MAMRRIPGRWQHGRRMQRAQRGVVAVEFALVLPVLVVLFGGMVEFGHAIYQYETLTKSVRNATRYLSEFSPLDPTYPVAAGKCLAVYGNTACTGSPLVDKLSTSNVVVCDRVTSTGCPGGTFGAVPVYDANNNGSSSGTPAGTINLVEVKITGYVYTRIETILNLAGLTFNDIATVMRQVL